MFSKFPALELRLSKYKIFDIEITPIETEVFSLIQSASKCLHIIPTFNTCEGYGVFDTAFAKANDILKNYDGRFKEYFFKRLDSLDKSYSNSLDYQL